MGYVNVHEAKTRLSQLIAALESGEVTEITIARNGKPAARLVPVPVKRPIRLGLAKGQFTVPDDFDADDEAIAELFNRPPDW